MWKLTDSGAGAQLSQVHPREAISFTGPSGATTSICHTTCYPPANRYGSTDCSCSSPALAFSPSSNTAPHCNRTLQYYIKQQLHNKKKFSPFINQSTLCVLGSTSELAVAIALALVISGLGLLTLL